MLPRREGTDEDADTRPRVVRAARRATAAGAFRPATTLRRVAYRRALGGVTSAAGPGGRAFVAWQEDGAQPLGRLWGAYARAGAGFGPAAPVSPDGGVVTPAALAFAPDGTLVAAWGWFLDAQRSGLMVASGRGVLGAPQAVSDPVPLDWGVRDVMRPEIAVDRRGAPTTFWQQQYALTDTTTYPWKVQTATGEP